MKTKFLPFVIVLGLSAMLLIPNAEFVDAKNLETEECNNQLNKMQKFDGSIVCIKSSSTQKLIDRGFITKIMPVEGNHISDLNSKIFSDQDDYSAPDTVYITILSADYNKDPQMIEEINSDPDLIQIKTEKSRVKQFKFVETGKDTGIFKGKFEIESNQDNQTDENLIVWPNDRVMIELYVERYNVKVTGNVIIR